MRLLTRVHHAVGLQVGGLGEAHLANVAFKRTFARVRPQMGREVGIAVESLLANFALVFLRVRPHMEHEVPQQAELLLANCAPMRLLSCVHHEVVLQGGDISVFILQRVR